MPYNGPVNILARREAGAGRCSSNVGRTCLLMSLLAGCGTGSVVPAVDPAPLLVPPAPGNSNDVPASGLPPSVAEPPSLPPNRPITSVPNFEANMWLHSRVFDPNNPNDRPGIFAPDGNRWVGRGVALNDMRDCDRCVGMGMNPYGTIAKIDRAVQGGANFVRLVLESYHSATDGQDPNAGLAPRQSWESVLFDAAYFEALVQVVNHVGALPNTYIMLSLWRDQSFTQDGKLWPTVDDNGAPGSQCSTLQAAHVATTSCVWTKLATAFRDYPYVLYGIAAEPAHAPGSDDAAALALNNACVQAIRSVEDAASSAHHLVSVSGNTAGRSLAYYADANTILHPITASGGDNVVYETHPYNASSDFAALFVDAAAQLPVLVGEFAPASVYSNMTLADCDTLVASCEAQQLSYAAWAFSDHCGKINCGDGGCGDDASINILTYPPDYTPANACDGSAFPQASLTSWGQHVLGQVQAGNQ